MAQENPSIYLSGQDRSNDQSIENLNINAVAAIREAIDATEMLAQERGRRKLSTSRVTGVTRELKELLKVMSAYCC